MTEPSSQRPAGLLAATLLAGVSVLAAPEAVYAAVPLNEAVNVLIRQSDFWRGRGRKDLADQALRRALAAAPRHPDVLAALARAAAADGDRAAAERWTAQLRAVAPNDPRLAQAAPAAPTGPAAGALAEARRLAQGGSTVEAAQAYRRLFGGQAPPEAYRLEYYQTLSGATATWEEGREGLRRLLAARPGDNGVKLAYAQALTYREATRREGVARLSELAAIPGATGQTARRAWRQALVWLGATSRDRPLYEAFLRANPTDGEIRAKLAGLDAPTRRAAVPAPATASAAPTAADRAAALRAQGFAALERSDQAGAQRAFEEALRLRPRDANALGGLGLVRLRAEDFAGARTLLQQAIDAAPAERGRWEEALNSARFFADYREASAAYDRDDFARAEQLLRPLTAPNWSDRNLARQLLAQVLSEQSRPAEAEALYRAILAEQPQQENARIGLIEALIAQNRFADAEALATSPSDRQVYGETRGRVALAQAKRAWETGDRAGARAAFESALALRPSDPWTRYDFARFLDDEGQAAAADGLIAPLPDLATPEALQVAALFAQRRGRPSEGYAYLTRIPAAQRTADMTALLGQLQVEGLVADAEAARRAGRPLEALASLRNLAGQPNLPVGVQSRVAVGLYDLGDAPQALALAQQSLTAERKERPAAYDGFVAVLTRAGRDAEAGALIRQLSGAANDAQQRRELTELAITMGAERADRLRLAGDFSGAFETLSSTFAVAPTSPRLLSALARLYQSGGMPERAGPVYEQLLRLRPGDQEALVGAAQAAVARRDWAQARAYLMPALSQAPDNPDLYILSASIEEGAGDRRAALRALETARALRQRQFAAPAAPVLPVPSQTASGGVLGPNPFAPGAAPLTPQRQAFALDGPAAGPTPAVMNPSQPARLQPAAWAPPQSAPAPAPAPAPLAPTAPWQAAVQAAIYGAAAPIATAPPQPPPFAAPYPAPLPPAPLAQPAAAANPFAASAASRDPVIAAIDQRIAAITGDVRSSVTAKVEFRGRSGERGLSGLDELSGLVSLTVSPFAPGQLRLSVKPVTLNAGTASGDSLSRLGGNPLELARAIIDKRDPSYPRPGPQSESGAVVGVGYEVGPLAIDVETTPLGFDKVLLGGGLSWKPRLGRNAVGRLWVERRPVTDSLTAYAGARDLYTGRRWGQVMRSTGGISFSYDVGRSGFYADAALSDYRGSSTPSNSSSQFNLGAYIRPLRGTRNTLQVGFNLNYQSYDNNQNFFTFGHGGYFSPKQFTAVSIPIDYTTQRGDWTFQLRAAPGYQSYTQEAALYFPTDPRLQGTLDALNRLDANVPRAFAAASQSGLGVSGSGRAEYRFSPGLVIGTEASFNNFGRYSETRFGIYGRQTLGEARR